MYTRYKKITQNRNIQDFYLEFWRTQIIDQSGFYKRKELEMNRNE